MGCRFGSFPTAATPPVHSSVAARVAASASRAASLVPLSQWTSCTARRPSFCLMSLLRTNPRHRAVMVKEAASLPQCNGAAVLPGHPRVARGEGAPSTPRAVACSGTSAASLLPILGCMGGRDYIQVIRWAHTSTPYNCLLNMLLWL